jgi:transcriptional regulator with XRE-family HTH domain
LRSRGKLARIAKSLSAIQKGEDVNELVEQLRTSFADQDYRAGYSESFMNSWVAAQIKVLREQRQLSQQELAELVGTKQAGISRLENTNCSAWKVQTLAHLARAFDVRLRISFEEFGTLPDELGKFGREFLKREPYSKDAVFSEQKSPAVQQLSENERKAMAPNEGFEPNLLMMPAIGHSEREKEVNAPNIDSAGESTRIRRVGEPQSERNNPSRDNGPEARGKMPFYDIPHGAEAV